MVATFVFPEGLEDTPFMFDFNAIFVLLAKGSGGQSHYNYDGGENGRYYGGGGDYGGGGGGDCGGDSGGGGGD